MQLLGLDTRRSASLFWWSLALLVLCSVPAFGTRFLNDMGFYSLVADKMLAGGVLYREAMDVKPPLVFVHYAAVFEVFGTNNMAAIKAVTMGWLALSALLVTLVRQQLAPTAANPAFAGFLFIVASFSGWGQDFLSTNTEILANLFIVGGVWFLVADDFRGRPQHLLAGGFCIGIAFLYRYQSCVALLAFGATVVVRHRQFDRKARRLLVPALGFAIPSAAFVLVYARRGALDELRLLLAYQAHYARDAEFYWPELLGRVLRGLAGLWPFVLLACWQSVAIVRRATASRGEIFQMLLAFLSLGGFFLGGHLYPHYLVQSLPPLAILAAGYLQDTSSAGNRNRPRWRTWFEANAVRVMMAIVGVFTVVNGLYFWTRSEERPRQALVQFVNTHSGPDDEVLLWTWRPEVLFQVNRRFATRQLVTGPLIGMPDRRSPGARRPGVPGLWPVFLRDLADRPPRLLFEALPGRSEWPMERFPELASFLAKYHPCRVVDDVCVYLRKG